MADEAIVPTDGQKNPDEELELDLGSPDDTEDVEALKERAEKATSFARQAAARAKKAEEENKALKAAKNPTEPKPQENINKVTLSEEDVEAKILLAQGMKTEMLDKLKKVAKATGKTLIEAQSDELFVAIQEKHEADQKAEKARLGASKGSGTVKKGKDLKTPGLTDTEHRELWRNSQG